MRNREATGRIGKWAAELNEFTIDYVHGSSIQSHALADFIADWTSGAQDEEATKDVEAWTVFCDDSWGTFGAGAATVLVAPSKVRTCYAIKLDFSCTNNIAEYKALLMGLRKLKAMGIRRAILKTDLQVILGHVDKSSKARDPKLEKYLDAVRRLEASFEGFSVKNIPRGENEHANLLAKSAAHGLPLPSEVFFETVKHLQLSSWKEQCSQFHLYIVKTRGPKSYPFSRATVFQMMKLITREWKQGQGLM
jgi:ribonuclease HI